MVAYGGLFLSAIQGKRSKITAMRTQFYENEAHENGGAIFATQTEFVYLESDFHWNSAILSGGAVYIEVCSILVIENKSSLFLSSSV